MREIVYSPRMNNPKPSVIAVGNVIGMLEELTTNRRIIVVTDQNLWDAHGHIIDKYPHIIIQQGETHKNLATIEQIHRELLAMEADRSSYIVGFGGGIVTDITGFAASTYMRGIGFGFVATSLLAQVDASVGGKNGVNLDGYKNIIGTFNQPDFVLCDLNILSTLPEREMRAGMGEVLKCAIIGDRYLFDILYDNSFEHIVNSYELMFEIVVRCVKFKASIVAQDEREGGVRKLLNLGHTFGHGVEKCTSKYIHGEAVAIGISIIARLSTSLANLADVQKKEIEHAIEMLSLPSSAEDLSFEQILTAAKSDKKRSGNTIELVLIDKIGECRIASMTIEELLLLKKFDEQA